VSAALISAYVSAAHNHNRLLTGGAPLCILAASLISLLSVGVGGSVLTSFEFARKLSVPFTAIGPPSGAHRYLIKSNNYLYVILWKH
jgi:hypothetical protein